MKIFKTAVIAAVVALALFLVSCAATPDADVTALRELSPAEEQEIMQLYGDCGLEGKLRYDIFRRAITGSREFDFEKENLITIIDFTRPSTDKRFHVIDLENRKVLFSTYVSHGVNTGENYAVEFSNEEGSRKSSLGFYRTAETYEGKHGYSLRLDGLQEGINERARERYIVIHSADYVSEEFIEKHGRLGRSWGCPALPVHLSDDIIDAIKEGSCLFIYADADAD